MNINPVVAIVGRPNVGKSTLFNRLAGKRLAITSKFAGTTRDRLYEEINWVGKNFMLVDTAGMLWEKEALDIQKQIQIAIREADLIIFLVDVTSGVTLEDEKAVEFLRKSKKRVILGVNKVDNQKREGEIGEFFKMGFKDVVPISAILGRNVGSLLDKITSYLKPKIIPFKEESPELKIAIIGRPNVGKSSLFNKLIGQERVVVSDIPGTTRDIITTKLQYQNNVFLFIDTAGLRRRGKIQFGIEKFSVLRALRALEEADLCLFLIDAEEGVTNQDLHIAGFAKEMGKAIILVVNKWDLAEKEKTMDQFLDNLRDKLDFIFWAPVIFISASSGKNISKIFDLIKVAQTNYQKRINTSSLNNFLQKTVTRKVPVSKIFYATQVKIKPPTFVFFIKEPEKIHFSYIRYLENSLRKEFDFTGTSIKIYLRRK